LIEKINFLNTFINIRDKKDYLKIINSSLESHENRIFFYLNTLSFYLLNNGKEFSNYFNKADYIAPDGYSIKLAINFLYRKKIEKVSFNHIFFDSLMNIFSAKNYRIFLLGGRLKSLENAAVNLLTNHPKLNIVGYNHGHFNWDNESNKIIDEINSNNSEILLVGIGMPESVEWIIKNKERLNVKVIFTVGNLFDIISGEKKIAPKFLYNTPFEWLFRLLQEPLKLTRRYIIVHPYFIYKVLKEKFLLSDK